MNELSPEQAFELLGLRNDADGDDLKRAFREKSQAHHPDRPNGDEQIQKKLNEAREVAEAVILGRSSLIALKSGRSILLFEKALAIEKAARQSNNAEKSFKTRHTRLLQQIKYLTLVLGVISAAVGWFGDNLLSDFAKRINPTGTGGLELNFKLMSLLFAATAGGLQFLVQQIEARIERFTEKLGDPRICASELAQALDYRDKSIVYENELLTENEELPEVQLGKKTTPTPHVFPLVFLMALDKSERQKMLLLKSVEHGLLVPVAQDVIRPDMVFTYRVAFAPSAFRSSREAVTPRKPVTAADAKTEMIAGIVMLALLGGLACFLGFIKHTYWAVAPAILALGGGGAIASGISDFRAASQLHEPRSEETLADGSDPSKSHHN